MTILVCFALKEEAAPFLKIADGKPRVETLLVGIGRQNAEKRLRHHLSSHCPQLVLTCGFAGGLDPGLTVGDVLFEIFESGETMETMETVEEVEHSRVIYGDCRSQLIGAGARPARFHCSERIATTVAEKKKLHSETNASAVEMESAMIHALCRERRLPCVTVRVISDTANEDLPLDFNALAKPDKSLDFGKLALAIVAAPGKIGALMELQKKTSFAAQRLAAVLDQITSP